MKGKETNPRRETDQPCTHTFENIWAVKRVMCQISILDPHVKMIYALRKPRHARTTDREQGELR